MLNMMDYLLNIRHSIYLLAIQINVCFCW